MEGYKCFKAPVSMWGRHAILHFLSTQKRRKINYFYRENYYGKANFLPIRKRG